MSHAAFQSVTFFLQTSVPFEAAIGPQFGNFNFEICPDRPIFYLAKKENSDGNSSDSENNQLQLSYFQVFHIPCHTFKKRWILDHRIRSKHQVNVKSVSSIAILEYRLGPAGELMGLWRTVPVGIRGAASECHCPPGWSEREGKPTTCEESNCRCFTYFQ